MSGFQSLQDENGGSYQNMDAPKRPPDFTSYDNEMDNKEGGGKARRDVISLFFTKADKNLLVSKAFYFFFYAAFGSLFPLIGIYFKQLGMNGLQAGVLIGVRPFVELASGPFWGGFVDRFKRAKLLLLISLMCWIVFTIALAFIQPPSTHCIALNDTHIFLQNPIRSKRDTDSYHLVGGQINHHSQLHSMAMLVKSDGHFMVKRQQGDEEEKIEDTEGNEYKKNPEQMDTKTKAVAMATGMSPEYVDSSIVSNYLPEYGTLVRPRFSTRVYRKSSVDVVFMLLLLLIIIGEFFSAPASTLADACTLGYLGNEPEYYIKQRMFGSAGWGLAMFFVGIALDYNTAFPNHPCGILDPREKNYMLCFAVFSVLMGCALIVATQFRFQSADDQRPNAVRERLIDIQQANLAPVVAEKTRARAPEPQESAKGWRWLSVLKTFSSPHYATFLVVGWWMGFGVGLVFAFLFWHLQDFGGTPTIFGIASVINHVSEIFAYFFSFKLMNSIGHIKVLYLGLFLNVLRFLYVSLLTDPWWIMPFEFLQGITHACVWSTLSSYMSLAAPAQVKSSAQTVLQLLHHAFGRGCGAIIGGLIITFAGTRVMFRIYGTLCLLILAVFFGINRFLKIEGIKYEASSLLDDTAHALAPHGIPMNPSMSPSESRDNMYGGYQVMEGYQQQSDPTQDAYDRYVHEPYDKPVRFETLPNLK